MQKQTKKKDEGDIQSDIMFFLQVAGWLAIKVIAANKAGYEVIAFRMGRAVFIEVKVPGKRLRKLQEFRKSQVKYHGFEHVTANSVDDVRHLDVTNMIPNI